MSAPTIMSFCVHGVPIEVVSDIASVTDVLTRRLREFAVSEDRPGQPADDPVRVTITGPRAVRALPDGILERARVVYDAPAADVRYLDDGDRLVADYHRRVEMDVCATLGVARLAVTGDAADDFMVAAYPLFTIALMELLKRRARFALHAACVARGGAGILFAGTSGAGKSTLAAAMTRRGCAFLSDDTVFLDGTPGHVLAFPDELDVTDQTIDMIPELAPVRGRDKAPGRPKHAVRVDEVFGTAAVLDCAASVLVLPRIAQSDTSVLEPVDADTALRELLPNVLLTDAASSQTHLDVLGALARATPAYRLHTGRDLDTVAEMLIGLLDTTQSCSIVHAEPT